MRALQYRLALAGLLLACATSSAASDLSYTFMDFQYIDTTVEALGVQSPVASQIVSVRTDNGDGVSLAGAVDFADKFYFGGSFQTSIVDVFGEIENPLIGTTSVIDDFDLVRTRFSLGYYRELSDNLDFVAELPRNANGKVLKRVLREPYWKEHSRRVS